MSTIGTEPREGERHHLVHNWGEDPPLSDRLVAAVAEQERVEEGALPPLDGSVDAEALGALFEPGPDGERGPGCVTFSYYGYTVLVQSTGRIVISRD